MIVSQERIQTRSRTVDAEILTAGSGAGNHYLTMNFRSSGRALFSILSLVAAYGCSSEPGPDGGTGGQTGVSGSGNGTAGTGVLPPGASGSANGTAGTSPVGTAGTSPVGAGGSGTGGAPTGVAGSAPNTGGTTGTGGTGAGEAGTSSTAGAPGTAGSAGTGAGGGTFTVPRGNSAGCTKAAPAGDNPDDFNKHEVDVTGVDPAFIAEFPPSPGNNGGYTYTHRNYYVKLPADYDPSKSYPVTFGGGGCGNSSGDSGKGGGQQPKGMTAIQIGLSYVYHGGACFEDDHANTPEPAYFDAVMKDISANYCIDLEKVFVGGWSSGAWEAYTLGLARGGVIRGIATGAGGLRKERPMPSGIPIAAILLSGAGDTTNPITGPTGSALARDEILKTNGCVGTTTMPFAGDSDCVQYTGCPAAFPVVWCTPAGGHIGGDGDHWMAVGAFWSALPKVP